MENRSEFEKESEAPVAEGFQDSGYKPFLQTNTARIIMVGVLTFILLIPLLFVQNLITERSMRKGEAVREVGQIWGSGVRFYGPVLRVPYTTFQAAAETDPVTQEVRMVNQPQVAYFYVFPEVLDNKTNVRMNHTLKRGMYNPVVFTSDMRFTGRFVKPDISRLEINPATVNWKDATVIIQTSNMQSIKSELSIRIDGNAFALEAGSQILPEYGTLETSKLGIDPDSGFDFEVHITYNGSDSIQWIPVGKSTAVSVDADWPSPSFTGAFAAQGSTKKITDESFHADWKVVSVNRPFPQVHKEQLPDLSAYSFGVRLIDTVDEYQQNERVVKYGFLVIGLTFLIFFLIQMTSRIPIHIFHYTMIGLALIMFYTLLLSITEHLSFPVAYVIASVAVIVMLSLYSYSILRSRRFSVFIASSLGGLYAFIYIIIQMEDYALLAGSIGLFAILGLVMYYSRKIDWSH